MSTNLLQCPICYEPYDLTLRLPRNIPTCGHTLCVTDRNLHEIKPITSLSGQVRENVQALEDMLKGLDEDKKQARERLASRKAAFMKSFREEFDELTFLLKAKEKELELGIEAVFQREEERIEMIVGEKAEIRKKIVKRIKGCQDLSSDEDIFRVISGDHEDIAKKMNEINFGAKLDGMEHALKEACVECGESLERAVRHVEGLRFESVYRSEMIDLVYQNPEEEEEEFDKNLRLLSKVPIKSEAFSFELDFGLWIKEKTNDNNGDANFNSFDLSQAHNISAMSFELNQLQTLNLSSEGLKTLSYMRSILPKLQSLYIFPSEKILMPFETFKEIFSVLFWRPSCLRLLDFSKMDQIRSIGNKEIKFLTEHLLQKAVNLKDIRLGLGTLRFGPGSLHGLLQSIASLADNLQGLVLNFENINIPEEVFCEIMVKMENIQVFELSVPNTRFGDRVLMKLITNIFRWMSKVYSIFLDFSGTRVTGNGIKELLLELPERLDSFRLDLQRNILINDECLEYFVTEKLIQMEQLSYLGINVRETSVSPQLEQEIQQKRYAI